jgi:hypothetical protein
MSSVQQPLLYYGMHGQMASISLSQTSKAFDGGQTAACQPAAELRVHATLFMSLLRVPFSASKISRSN